MEAKERLEKLLEYLNISRYGLAGRISLPPHRLQDIARGKSSEFPYEVADKISKEFPHISKRWLLTGEGEMLKSNNQSVGDISNSRVSGVNISGDGNNINPDIYDDLMRELEKKNEQIDRLLGIIERSGYEK